METCKPVGACDGRTCIRVRARINAQQSATLSMRIEQVAKSPAAAASVRKPHTGRARASARARALCASLGRRQSRPCGSAGLNATGAAAPTPACARLFRIYVKSQGNGNCSGQNSRDIIRCVYTLCCFRRFLRQVHEGVKPTTTLFFSPTFPTFPTDFVPLAAINMAGEQHYGATVHPGEESPAPRFDSA